MLIKVSRGTCALDRFRGFVKLRMFVDSDQKVCSIQKAS